MKKSLKVMLCLFAVLCLAITVAAPYGEAALSCNEGEELEWTLTQESAADASTTYSSASVTSGACPGLSLSVNESGSAIILSGTPTAPGTYNMAVSYVMADGSSNSFFVELVVNPAPTGDPLKPEDPAEDPEPEETPKPELVITKSPSGETIDEGGRVMFIAAADNYLAVEWQIVSGDGTYSWFGPNEIIPRFQGMGYEAYKGGDGREYLILSNVPALMNGFSVEAVFTDVEGMVQFTAPATVTVIAKEPEQTAEPTPTPAATPEPTPTPTPEPTPAPTPDAAAEAEAAAILEQLEQMERPKRDHTLLYASVAAGAVLLMGLTALIVRIRISVEEKKKKRR